MERWVCVLCLASCHALMVGAQRSLRGQPYEFTFGQESDIRRLSSGSDAYYYDDFDDGGADDANVDGDAYKNWNVWVGSGSVVLITVLAFFFCCWNSMLAFAFMGKSVMFCVRECKFVPSVGCICPHWAVGIIMPFMAGGLVLCLPVVLVPYCLSVFAYCDEECPEDDCYIDCCVVCRNCCSVCGSLRRLCTDGTGQRASTTNRSHGGRAEEAGEEDATISTMVIEDVDYPSNLGGGSPSVVPIGSEVVAPVVMGSVIDSTSNTTSTEEALIQGSIVQAKVVSDVA